MSMEPMGINYPYVTEFLHETLPEHTGLLRELEQYALAHDVPILQKDAAAFLSVLVAIQKPGRILEIGTAIGYSALLLYEASGGVPLVTVERDADMVRLASEHFRRYGADIYVAHGDGLAELAKMSDPFDFIFLDAAKGQYPQLFAECLRLLAHGGVIVTDNVLFKGRVADRTYNVHKSRTITTRLRAFLAELCRDPALQTALLPVGDGMAVTRRK